MAKPSQPDQLNPLALRGVDLAILIGRSPVTDSKGQKVHLTPAAISNWVSRGNCPRNPDGTYNAIHVLAWLAAEHSRIPYRSTAKSDEMGKAKLEQMRERTKAIRQARLAEEKKLIDREDAKREMLEQIYLFKNSLLAWERSLGRDLLGLQDARAIEAKIKERTRDLLFALSDGWTPTEAEAEAGAIPKHDDAQSSGSVTGEKIDIPAGEKEP